MIRVVNQVVKGFENCAQKLGWSEFTKIFTLLFLLQLTLQIFPKSEVKGSCLGNVKQ